MPIPMIAALAPTIFKGLSGLNQIRKGKAMNPVRPEYEIPDAITDNTAMFRARANTQRLPGQSMYENQIESGMAGNLNALQQSGVSGAALAASANAMNSSSAGSINQLANMGMQNQMQNQQLLANANQTQAGFEDKAWDYNEKQKFEEEAAARSALLEAGNKQIFGAMDDLGSAYIQSPSMQQAGDDLAGKIGDGVRGLFQRRAARKAGDVSGGVGSSAATTQSYPQLSAGQIGSMTGQGNPLGMAGGTTSTGFGMINQNPFVGMPTNNFQNPYQYNSQQSQSYNGANPFGSGFNMNGRQGFGMFK